MMMNECDSGLFLVFCVLVLVWFGSLLLGEGDDEYERKCCEEVVIIVGDRVGQVLVFSDFYAGERMKMKVDYEEGEDNEDGKWPEQWCGAEVDNDDGDLG